MSAVTVRPFPKARRGTYTFLQDARETCHVYLAAEVDATRLTAARTASSGKVSFISFVVKAAADVVAGYPDARAVLRAGPRPRIADVDGVYAKVLFDKTVDGQRCVVSGTVPCGPERSVLEVQDAIDTYKDAEIAETGPFQRVRRMQQLPLPVARIVYRLALRNPARRVSLQGTFSVTSVGHEPVRVIYPMISGPLGFGMGRITDVPVARDGQILIIPQFTLSLAFDHRVLDGALASEVLARVTERLELWELL
ncbi:MULTISPECIES: 2-oxo acid dehydrogenase subunit E2 [unclassified Frankia]